MSGHNNELSDCPCNLISIYTSEIHTVLEYVNKPFSVVLWTAWKWTYYAYFLFSYFFIGVTNHEKSTIVKRSSSLSHCCSNSAKNSARVPCRE